MNAKAPELTKDNADLYVANQNFNKLAELRWKAAGYELSWGKQEFDGPHMVIRNSDGSFYGCALEEFFTTHKPCSGPYDENKWYKNVEVLAKQVQEDTDIVTMVGGKEEARCTIPAGEWIVRNPKGEHYCVSTETLNERYTKCENQK